MKKYSYAIMASSFMLFGLGLIILMSASSVYSVENRESLFAIFNAQLLKGLVGFVLMIIFAAIPYEYYKSFSKPALFAIILVLIATRCMASVNNVHRWFTLGFISFQPAEFAKIILFIHLAKLLEEKKEILTDFTQGFRYPLFWMIIVGGLVMIQPSFSNAIIILSISFLMITVAGARWKHLVSTLAAGLIPIVTAAMLVPYARGRIMKFVSAVFSGENYDPQVHQSIIGLGSGGFIGRGIGNSWQRNLHLPEAYGDFIFAISGEELGFIGSLIIISFFFGMFFIGMIIAKNAKDMFGQLLAFAISGMFMVQALIHISVSVGLMPNTGIPLPFVSHGGTSLLMICVSLGILMRIGLTQNQDTPTIEPNEEQAQTA
ncbi:MAG: FtsW/RodA/SpoVE family cell cycle protein [Ignavibacteria bacterium]|nr:FtsW/RodA/SpoVE family cell cycle protein [Ignavibacteria bacterium]